MAFTKETDFENALIKLLTESCGWEPEVLHYKTERDLLQNWANILFENNRSIDRLNDYPLTEGEMQQILAQIEVMKTPLKLNGFINGKSVSIIRDNPYDKAHFGKEVSLKIYDRQEIAAGQSRYQIAQQPKFTAKTSILPDRRGDFMLLINGMPLIHVELKKSGIPVSQAYNQIEKYAHEGVFTGLFSLIQVFVAMNPDEAVYFANPGPEGKFNRDFYFHWADFNNEPINDWKRLAYTLLSIPMAHQLIGFYTVADNTDGVLKVMRSYQYYAANKISDTVAKHKWDNGNQLGGYVWHTTGSGKTMTSFKSAQLIANSKDADKVVFLVDRIELSTQSASEYRGFAEETDSIQETEDTAVLIAKLKSSDPANTLIVTSIQKMSNIKDDSEGKLKKADIDLICAKRIVFIVDECHRSSFGEMMQTIKQTFPKALFFGFTGTPIELENEKKGNTTADVFGNELHRYSIADGIRDKNVLGFDPDKVLTFKERDMRQEVALDKANASSVSEVFSDAKKKEIYYKYMNDVPMAGYENPDGTYVKGIEDFLLEKGQYRTEEHQKMVVQDILENWVTISHNYKFHGLFATSSISEAVQYYKRFKKEAPYLKVTALFDPSIDNNGTGIEKEEALCEIITDYNMRYGQTFALSTYGKMKKDIQNRMAHKKPYERIDNTPEEQIDLLIVVDQMLTGYDSKWINVLYLDKVIRYENIIQAFSRTNRLFGPDKPFGTIKYYRAPYSMERNINAAVKLYSGDKPLGMFAIKLDKNLENINAIFTQIKNLFEQAGIINFEKLPTNVPERKQFAKLFRQFNDYLESAKVQGFVWDKSEYSFTDEETGEVKKTVRLLLDEKTYKILALRYKELFTEVTTGPGEESPYDLTGYLTTIDTDEIDADYMNSRFEKYKKALTSGNPEDVRSARDELHNTFAALTQEEQKYANIFLHDLQSGDVSVEPGKTLRDYISEYRQRAKDNQTHKLAAALGLDEQKLRDMMELKVDDATINEYGRLDNLKATVDKTKAKAYFETLENNSIPMFRVNSKVDELLRKYIISGGFEINIPDEQCPED
jgi:type I restriction enzyme R subunit